MTDRLHRLRDKVDLMAVDRELRRGRHYDRADARIYSLAGEIRRLMGDLDGADEYYDKALVLSKTEVNALRRLVIREIESARMDAALAGLDLLLRRWPANFPRVAPLFSMILADPTGYQAALNLLGEGVPWRGSVVNFLARDPQAVYLANRLVLDLTGAPVPTTASELASVMNGYIAQKRYDAAYRLFLFATPEEKRKFLGYVFNASFSPIVVGGPFDWRLQRVPGVEVKFIERTGLRGADGGARVNFFGQPVKGQLLGQLLQLPPGSYQLILNASGRGLRLPRKLFWLLQCVSGADRDRARLDLPEGSFDNRTLTAQFVISADCPAQILSLNSGLTVDSWFFRYQGQLTMHNLRIEAVGA